MGTTKTQKLIVEQYNSNPNHCLYCGKPILHVPKPGRRLHATKTKRFCCQSCAASYNNTTRTTARKRKSRICAKCGTDFGQLVTSHRKFCPDCWQNRMLSKTKKEISRAEIGGHARYMLRDRMDKCERCGYKNHVEACHIRPVRDFPPETTIAEINDPKNLMALCPNHHWELDHGLLGTVD